MISDAESVIDSLSEELKVIELGSLISAVSIARVASPSDGSYMAPYGQGFVALSTTNFLGLAE